MEEPNSWESLAHSSCVESPKSQLDVEQPSAENAEHTKERCSMPLHNEELSEMAARVHGKV